MVGIAVVLLLVIVLAVFFLRNNTAAPPDQVTSLAARINYPVYYPSRLPAGYSYTDGSAKLQSGLLYYKLHNGTKTISITEQPITASSVDLQKLPNYSSLNVPAGPAAIGVSIGNPAVVIATGSTLVNINSSKGVSKDTVISLAMKINEIKVTGSG